MDFTDCDLTGAVFESVDFADARFDGATMRGIDAMEVKFSGGQASLKDADFSGASLYDVRFVGATLVNASFEGAHRGDRCTIVMIRMRLNNPIMSRSEPTAQ